MTTTTVTEQTRAVVEGYVAALRSGSQADREGYFSPDSTWTLIGDLPTSGTWTGPGEIFGGFLPKMLARLDPEQPITQDVHAAIADGERAVAVWTTRATALSGEPYVNEVVIVFRVIGGKIVEAREYFDTAYAGRVLFAQG